MMDNMQFTAVILMTLMTVALAAWMPRRLYYDKVANRSRWLMAAGLALLGVQFAIQYHHGFRSQGVTQAVFVNLLFFIPCSALLSLSMLNLQRQGRIRLTEWLAGPITLAIVATIMIGVGLSNGHQLMSDTPEMRNAEMMGSVCYIVMQIYYTYLLLTELRRMRLALANYYDRERSSLLNWMQYSIALLTVLALTVPVLIYSSGILLAMYGLLFFGGIFCLWLQFIGYIRTNALKSMREAEEDENTEDDNKQRIANSDYSRIEEAAGKWLEAGSHLHSGITIKSAAEEMHVARYLLTAWLKTTRHGQFSQWITYHRIEAAKQMLKQHTDWSNETIAQACGFSTRNYFQTVFKKNIGLSPTEYQAKEKVASSQSTIQ